MIKIRKHLRKDIPYRVPWLNNPLVSRFLGDDALKKTTLKKEKQWFDSYVKNKDKKFFTICDGLKPVGFMGLNVNRANRNAELFIAIGDDEYHGKGVGRIAMKWLIDYGFKKLKLHKVNLGVVKDNVPAVRLYESLGFVVEGEQKGQVFSAGCYHDLLCMAIFNR